MKTCKICGKKSESDYCFLHKPRKPIPVKWPESKGSKMKDFFLTIWKKRGHQSEVSGERLFSPPSSAYFHHILPKDKYEEAMFDEENMIILTIDEHGNVENNPQRYKEINNRRDYLLKKYNYI